MRLEKIKLAGFKSFVDPTTVPMPSNLVGVVGPNGCGKSNVIDAVRWVMGESSAKMLRGESMADVIFNGSSSRKPVGTATIELVFENSDGSAGGQYAQYNEISVKRQVSRDGQSSYFLNGVRCRRRDITDLFLGTGLGPRSYSIIEQGMISRLIEARPEELRVFLEEAAGISKYKERRRETENRMARTRENLDRLDDLREEVAKQLHHLQRQAATAEKYQRLKQEERQLKAQLLALRWQNLHQELSAEDRGIGELETRLQAAIARQRRLESGIEQDREKHHDANERFNEVQGRFYALGAEISRLEQAIQFSRDAIRNQTQDLEQAERAWRDLEEHRREDEARLEELTSSLDEQTPALQEAREAEQMAAERLEEAQLSLQAWQADWDRFNQEAAEPAQTAQVERTRINQLEKQETQLRQRLQRLDEELGRLQGNRLGEEIALLEQREIEVSEHAAGFQQALEEVLTGIREVRDANATRANDLDRLRAELQGAKGRRASLEALQQAALGKQEDGAAEWLEARNLHRAERLAQHLEVPPRWQGAVEMVLGHHLQAVCVEDLAAFGSGLSVPDGAALELFDLRGESSSVAGSDGNGLLTQVQAPPGVAAMLAGVRVAEDLEEAFALRQTLGAGESVVTPDGVWLGGNWVRLGGDQDGTGGVLARERELKLDTRIVELSDESEVLAQQLQEGREVLQQQEHAREESQGRLNEVNRQLSDIRSDLSGKRTRAEHLQHRRESLLQESQEVREQIEADREHMEQAREHLHSALERMETFGSRREAQVKRRDALRQELNQSGEDARTQRDRAHQIALRIESMRSALESLQQNRERMIGQIKHLDQRREELRRNIEEAAEPLQTKGEALEEQLARRVAVEAELAEVRRALEEMDNALRAAERERHEAEQGVQEVRAELEQKRMHRQEVLVRGKTVEEQLRETGLERDEILSALPAEANEEDWQQLLDKMGTRIQRLGPINLAAIDEYQEQSQRMEYLDAQHADVSESLETLENAIRKIDRETRTRFKEVFDKVNLGLQEMFPKLFGGGHAYLQLTGEDLLDTGVGVMARPPGKRISSIHLLSGGEKALTAVALVFSIFELNPAPFCMLDEVDAPLDDANVSRFCELVKSMSDRVQFIFITHNKGTMEIANQLTGVTMHEPGVSRLVSVDVEQAAQLAAL